MTDPVMVVRAKVGGDGPSRGRACWLWCPGCNDAHRVVVEQATGFTGPVWEWDGDLEHPTFSPSILVHGITKTDGTAYAPRCHSFIRAGRWEYLSDSTHALAGQTVDMVPLPDWLVSEGDQA